MPSSIRSAKSVSSVRGRVPGSAWPNKAAPYRRTRTIARRTSEHHLERKLNCARRARFAECAEVGVHLPPGSIESRTGKETGELRVIPRVEQLRAELNKAGFREQRHAFGDVDVPVVDSGAAQDIHSGIAEISGRCTSEGIGVEVPEKIPLARRQISVADYRDARSFGR